MKRKILIGIVLLILVFSFSVSYFNMVVLPKKIRVFIIEGVRESINKQADIESLQFSLFKGLVIKNLVIFDENMTLLRLKEGSCSFLFLPLFKKIIIVPHVRLDTLTIFLERRPDKTFNITELLDSLSAYQGKRQGERGLRIFINKISLVSSRVEFKDKTFEPELDKSADNLNLTLNFSLSGSIKFNFASEISGEAKTTLAAEGEYNIVKRALTATASIRDLALQEFRSYYQDYGLTFTGGSLDSIINVNLEKDMLNVNLETKSKKLQFSKDKFEALLNSLTKTYIRYSLRDKLLTFAGHADIERLDISGLYFFDKADNITGGIEFDNSNLYAEKLTANLLGMSVEARLRIADYKSLFIDLEVNSQAMQLREIENILKDKFKFSVPGFLKGKGKLSLKIKTKLPAPAPFPLEVFLDVSNATYKLEDLEYPFQDISGRLEFSRDRIIWPELNFEFLGINYKTEGDLVNFKTPDVRLSLSSENLLLESEFGIKDKLINFSKLTARYFNSEFRAKGKLDISKPSSPQAGINIEADIDLEDFEKTFKKFKENFKNLKPLGIVHADITLGGNIREIKSCDIQAGFFSSNLSVYGLNSSKFSLDYRQENGLIDMPIISLFLYDGEIKADAKMNLASENLPFLVSAKIEAINLAKMKLDTGVKDKDLAGILNAQLKLNGFYKKPSMVTGEGSILITKGKLWELNLLQGLGKLLFAKDFINIVFDEARCEFIIKEKSVFSDNLKMNSTFVDLAGFIKIDFNGTIDGALNVHVDDEFVPLSGTFKDVTTAIIGQAGRFGVIKISGTLEEPKYKFQAAVFDIIRALKEAFFGK